MIPSLIVIALAFACLLYESDWLRIRLIVGPIPSPKPIKTINLYQCRDWYHGKDGFATIKYGFTTRESGSYYNGQDHAATLFHGGIEEPICGWDWLLNHLHPLVEQHIELVAFGCRHSITLCDNADQGKIIKEVCKIAFQKNMRRNGNGRKPKRKGETFNPYYTLKSKTRRSK